MSTTERDVRRAALATILLGSVVLVLLGVRPSRGQDELATVSLSCPAAAARGRTTRVSLEFTLPAGCRLLANPRVRVTDARGKLTELLPTYTDRVPPVGAGHRDLHTGNYRTGAYDVWAELEYVNLLGARKTATSKAAVLSVSRR